MSETILDLGGEAKYPIQVVGETPKCYRVKWILDKPFVPSKSGTVRYKGDVFLVPKPSVKTTTPLQMDHPRAKE
jgi:hypothetical protein